MLNMAFLKFIIPCLLQTTKTLVLDLANNSSESTSYRNLKKNTLVNEIFVKIKLKLFTEQHLLSPL